MYFLDRGCYICSMCGYRGRGVLRISDIFRTAGFLLICNLVVSEKLRIYIIKIISVVFVVFLWLL
jgi:hypothetical protein